MRNSLVRTEVLTICPAVCLLLENDEYIPYLISSRALLRRYYVRMISTIFQRRERFHTLLIRAKDTLIKITARRIKTTDYTSSYFVRAWRTVPYKQAFSVRDEASPRRGSPNKALSPTMTEFLRFRAGNLLDVQLNKSMMYKSS